MATRVEIDGERFLIDGQPTYDGVYYNGKPIEGLLLNARMIQAIVDDENPETCRHWAYPDTGEWDPERNTNEFCLQLPEYRRHGLLAVTVGLQGGGSIYRPDVWDTCRVSAFAGDGSLKPDWTRRLEQVLAAADAVGMVVIVNVLYWKQVRHIPDDAVLTACVEHACDWLLRSGHRNVLVDVCNESASWWSRPVCEPENVHRLIDAAKAVTLRGERLLVGCSTGGSRAVPTEAWQEAADFDLPHGNGCTPAMLREKLRAIKAGAAYRRRPRPVLVNEDSIRLENLDAALEEQCSWGFFAQGRGSFDQDYEAVWGAGDREARYEHLSGFQTLPVNWSINTPFKEDFFTRLRRVTGRNGQSPSGPVPAEAPSPAADIRKTAVLRTRR